MEKSAGLTEIDQAKWSKGEFNELNITVHDMNGTPVTACLQKRQHSCDRGHISFKIFGLVGIDECDSFPRYSFNFEEADTHVRNFLKWRLWKQRENPHSFGDRFN